jgi:hypothetical protein
LLLLVETLQLPLEGGRKSTFKYFCCTYCIESFKKDKDIKNWQSNKEGNELEKVAQQ